MAVNRGQRLRLIGALAALLLEAAQLAWEHAHGGVVHHHLLNRADLPAISNGWGLVLLPALTWYLLGRVLQRSAPQASGSPEAVPPRIVAAFAGSLLFGLLLSSSFAAGLSSLTDLLFQGLLVLALLLPVYRAECVLGFVLGMSFVFGVALPLLVATIIAALSALIRATIHPLLVRLWDSARGTRTPHS